MCDVDDEAVVAAVDAPSIYDIPKVLHTRGPRRLRRAPPRPAVPRRRLDRVGRPAAPGAPPGARGHGRRWSASTSTCPTPTCRSTEALRAGGFAQRRAGQHPLGGLRRLRDAGRVPPQALGDVDAHLRARRLRRPRHRGQARRAAATPARHGIPTLGLCLGLQCMVIEYARNVAGLDGRQLRRVRPETPRTRSSPRWPTSVDVVDGRARHGRHDAPRASTRPTLADGLAGRARPTATPYVDERHRHRYEVNNAYRDAARGGRAWCSPGTSPDGHLVEFVELPARGAPLLRRHPGAPGVPVAADRGRTRCSRA